MPTYSELRKLDDESLEKLQEGSGPVHECLCSVLAPPEDNSGRKGIKASIKRAFDTLTSVGRDRYNKTGAGSSAGSGGQMVPFYDTPPLRAAKGAGGVQRYRAKGQTTIDIPLTFANDGKGIYTTKEEVVRKTPCGRCGCDKEKFVLKHSYANIKVTTPDISTLCPCPGSKCLPGKDAYHDNVTITVERAGVKTDPDIADSESDLYGFFLAGENKPPEPNLNKDKRSLTSLIEDSHEENNKSGFYKKEDFDDWSDQDAD